MTKHKVDDIVAPRPEYKGIAPAGRVRRIERWGAGYVYYLEGHRPAYVDWVFEDLQRPGD